MGERETPSETVAAPVRRRQFSLRVAFLLMAACAFVLGHFIYFYPYSAFALPYLLCWPLVEIGRRAFRRAVSAKEAAASAVGIYLLGSLVLAGITDPAEMVLRSQCMHNLRQIGLGLERYRGRYGPFPPAYIPDGRGRPMHSWRVLILPWMQDEDLTRLYRRYRFDEPWNGPNNSKLDAELPRVYRCPEDKPENPFTSYVAVSGPETMWDGARATQLTDIKDGAFRTIGVVERANSGIHWMEPRDLDFQTMPMVVNPPAGTGISSEHRAAGWRGRRLGAIAAFADGHVCWLLNNIPSEALRAMLTIAGGETVEPEDPLSR